MSNPITFYRDKKEKFKCSLHIDGASPAKSFVRLCLEMSDGSNYFFKGKIDSSGQCLINIPALPNITSDEGTAIVEVIAESSYFNVYETPVRIKNSISVKFEPELTNTEEIEESDKPKISFTLIEEEKEEPEIDMLVEDKREIKQEYKQDKNYLDLPDDYVGTFDSDEFTTFDNFIKKLKI